jgi:AcrR family transcriptional regulator
MPGRPDDSSLRLKKQQFVRSEIWNTAVDLFAEHGYDRTTVDDIAIAAGVSRRTFFRYFASKDDVMVQATDTYGDLLVDAVKESAGAAPLQIIERAVRRLAAFVVVQPRARLAMQIVLENPSARGAQLSEYSVITERVAEAFAAAGAGASGHAPTLLASLTFVLLNRVFQSWYERSGEIGPIVDEVVAAFHDLARAPRQHASARRVAPPVGKPRPSRRLQSAR